jgi:uncharacterized protein YyaL (SSP411 family)
MASQSGACGALLSALDRFHHDHEQFVLAVADDATLVSLRPSLFASYRPHGSFSWVVGQAPESGPLVALNRGRHAIDGEPTLYRCNHFSCDQPISQQALDDWLGLHESG